MARCCMANEWESVDTLFLLNTSSSKKVKETLRKAIKVCEGEEGRSAFFSFDAWLKFLVRQQRLPLLVADLEHEEWERESKRRRHTACVLPVFHHVVMLNRLPEKQFWLSKLPLNQDVVGRIMEFVVGPRLGGVVSQNASVVHTLVGEYVVERTSLHEVFTPVTLRGRVQLDHRRRLVVDCFSVANPEENFAWAMRLFCRAVKQALVTTTLTEVVMGVVGVEGGLLRSAKSRMCGEVMLSETRRQGWVQTFCVECGVAQSMFTGEHDE